MSYDPKTREHTLPDGDVVTDVEIAFHNGPSRRAAIRNAMLIATGIALGKIDALTASGGQLTCDLDQWSHVVFKHKGKSVRVPVSEIFDALVSVNK